MSADQPFRPDLKNKAKQSFTKTTPDAFRRLQNQGDATAMLRNIDVRANDLKSRMRKHFKRQQETWVAREAIKVWQKRSAPRQKLPTPRNIISNSLAPEQIMKQARINVRRRMAQRLSGVNQTKTRMENTVVRSEKFSLENPDLKIGRAFKKTQIPKRKMKRGM